MNIFSILTKEDYLRIKMQIAFAVVGIVLSIAIFLGVDYLTSGSLRDLRIAQSDFNNARSRVDLIEEEEATIIEYIERYQELDAQGVVDDEDRLLMFEKIAEIRSANNLFPVSLNISEQLSQNLQYPADIRDPGDPIALRSSIIGLTLPLLHEGDLIRLVSGILNTQGLYQTKSCNIAKQNPDLTNFIVLSQHLTADCEILWYTFNLNPPAPSPFGF